MYLMKKTPKVYLHRTDIDWKHFNNDVVFRYWVCGTSLIAVANNIIGLLLDEKR